MYVIVVVSVTDGVVDVLENDWLSEADADKFAEEYCLDLSGSGCYLKIIETQKMRRGCG